MPFSPPIAPHIAERTRTPQPCTPPPASAPRWTTRSSPYAARRASSRTPPSSTLLDPHCDLLLVGDSVGMVVHGLPTTVGATLDVMILHGRAVVRGSRRALLAVDLPFGTYERSPRQAYASAAQVLAEARAADAAGAFALVVEGVARDLADEVTHAVSCPTIGIGASAGCDGQVLVTEDLLGLFEWSPKFVLRYADLRGVIGGSAAAFADDVRTGRFPDRAETYALAAPAADGAASVSVRPAG